VVVTADRRKWLLGGLGAAVVVAAVALVLASGWRDDRADVVEAAGPASTTATTFRPATTTATTAAPPTTVLPTTTAPPTTAAPTTTTAPPPSPPVDQARLEALAVPADACPPADGDDAHRLAGSALGDLDGDGIGDGLAAFACTSGLSNREEWGVWAVFAARPDPVPVLFGQGLTSRFELDLFDQSIAAGAAVLDIGAAHEYDPHCCSSQDVRETYTWDGGTFVRTSRVVRDAESSTAAVIAGDTTAATPETAAAIAAAVADHGPLLPGQTCDLAPAPGYACTVALTDGTPATLTWEHQGFFAWRAVAFAAGVSP
jgi:hypothetical protein